MSKAERGRLPAFAFPLARRGAGGRLSRSKAEKKNPLTFDSYVSSATCSGRLSAARDSGRPRGRRRQLLLGGDVHEIIGPLTKMEADERCSSHTIADLGRRCRALPPQPMSPRRRRVRGRGATIPRWLLFPTCATARKPRRSRSCSPRSSPAATWRMRHGGAA